MIKSVKLTNFFSFISTMIELGNLTTLIGINGSGKSNFIKAFSVLKAVVAEGGLEELILNQWGGFDAIYFNGESSERDNPFFSLSFEFDPRVLSEFGCHRSDAMIYEISFAKLASTGNFSISESLKTMDGFVHFDMKNGRGYIMKCDDDGCRKIEYILPSESESIFSQVVDKERYPQVYAIREAIRNIAIYSCFDTSPSGPLRRPASPSGATRLLPDGANLPQLLNKIKINKKSDYIAIRDSLNSVNPNYTGIDFNVLGSNLEIMLEEARLDRSIHVTHISDGTLRYLCLLAIIHNSKRGSLICIDEPESGLHPDMIAEIMEGINGVCEESQFIISTHSEYVLNQVGIKNLMVFEKNEINSTEISSFTDSEFQEWASHYAIGRLWRNGDLGGNRY